MTITDQLKIIDNKIKANQPQYDLDRLAAKIFAYSSVDLRKYEYLTGEDLVHKPSVIEQAKFEYSPLGNFLNKGLKEEDKKEGLLKTKTKSCEIHLVELIKLVRLLKMRVIIIMTPGTLFTGFTETLKNLRECHLTLNTMR